MKYLNNEIHYKKNGFIKSRKLKNKNIDTIILDSYTYESGYENNNNFKNIIINDKKLKTNPGLRHVIEIKNTKAENIYFFNKKSLGGLTIPIEMAKYELHLWWENEKRCNLKEINFALETKTEIELSSDVKEIILYPHIIQEKLDHIVVYIVSEYYTVRYYIDEKNGIKHIEYDKYEYNKSNIKNGVLDLRDINKYNRITCEEMMVDTLIINKKVMNNIYFKNNFTDKLKINKLNIIDDNEMKLNPINEIILDDKLIINKTYLLDSKHSKLIFYDRYNNIKVIDKEELLKDELVEKVDFIFNSESNLVIIKYKNNEYKIIDKDIEYKLDSLFNKFLLLNLDKYDFYDNEKLELNNYINSKDYYSIFNDGIIDNNLLYIIYKDYVEFVKYINELKKIGFKDEALYYLIKKKYENIINTKSKNLLKMNKISKDEIDMFNKLGEKEIMKKLLKK